MSACGLRVYTLSSLLGWHIYEHIKQGQYTFTKSIKERCSTAVVCFANIKIAIWPARLWPVTCGHCQWQCVHVQETHGTLSASVLAAFLVPSLCMKLQEQNTLFCCSKNMHVHYYFPWDYKKKQNKLPVHWQDRHTLFVFVLVSDNMLANFTVTGKNILLTNACLLVFCTWKSQQQDSIKISSSFFVDHILSSIFHK